MAVAAALRTSRESLGRGAAALPGLRAEQFSWDGDPTRNNTISVTNGGKAGPHVGVPETGQSISNDILFCGDPRRLDPVTASELKADDLPSHLEAERVPGPAVLEEETDTFIVGETVNRVTAPLVAPQRQGDDVGEKLEISDVPGGHVRRDAGSEELVRDKVIPSNSRPAVQPAVARSIQGDVRRVDRDEKGPAVPRRHHVEPPGDVQLEVIVQGDLPADAVSVSLCSEDTAKEDSTGRDNVADPEKTTCEGGQLLRGGVGPDLPVLECLDDRDQLLLRKRHSVPSGVVQQAEGGNGCGRRCDMARCSRQLEAQLLDQLDEGVEQESRVDLRSDAD